MKKSFLNLAIIATGCFLTSCVNELGAGIPKAKSMFLETKEYNVDTEKEPGGAVKLRWIDIKDITYKVFLSNIYTEDTMYIDNSSQSTDNGVVSYSIPYSTLTDYVTKSNIFAGNNSGKEEIDFFINVKGVPTSVQEAVSKNNNSTVKATVFYHKTQQATQNLKYTNPVSDKILPDPSVIRAHDGMFYVYATDNGQYSVPIYKSGDLVNWTAVGGAFTDSTRPSFVQDGGIWAPDINYINGQYVLYYSLSKWGGEWECGIGVATSASPAGPFKDHGKLFISSEIDVKNSIDPCYFEDTDGKKYLFWGSFRGIYAVELSEDGLTVKPETKFQVAPGQDGNINHTEATMIVKRGDYYYLMGSSGSCCDGERSTYHIVVARSKSIKGPFVNKANENVMDNKPFETILQKSNKVLGPGHNSELMIDDNGDYWMLYHGFEATNPDAGRLLYLDKVSWDAQGWPYIEGGKPSSEAAKPYFKNR